MGSLNFEKSKTVGFARGIGLLLGAALAALFAAGCGGSGESGEAGAVEGTIQATTTTTHITDMVETIGGEEVETTALMGPGVDPHLYEASQGDISALQEADVIFYNGLFLEGQLNDTLIQIGQQTPTVQVTSEIPEDDLLPSEDYEGQADPHVWFAPELWLTGVGPVVEQLSELKPDAAEDFERRGEEYRAEAMEAHEYVCDEVETIPEEDRILVTSHDAFRYFGGAYGFEVRGLQGISTDAEAGAGDVSELADFLVEEEIPAIFPESSVSPRSLEAVEAAAEDRGLDLAVGDELFADAMGEPGTEEGTYAGMLRANADTIVAGLGG
ncbi:MAG: zinc ABC transporter substrate-binding protein [Rubrobacter sp.]|jgi:manganese/zinc/iron transport system substrate-binding protein|nr:zinc ABC transporter substrate-binding protein [Rubrobacter sp.]